MSSNLRLGIVKWYRTYNKKKECVNDYGFVTEIKAKEEMYFRDVANESLLINMQVFDDRRPVFVVFLISENRMRRCAVKVKLLEETTEDEQEQLSAYYSKKEIGDPIKDYRASQAAYVLSDLLIGTSIEDYLNFIGSGDEKAISLLINKYSAGKFGNQEFYETFENWLLASDSVGFFPGGVQFILEFNRSNINRERLVKIIEILANRHNRIEPLVRNDPSLLLCSNIIQEKCSFAYKIVADSFSLENKVDYFIKYHKSINHKEFDEIFMDEDFGNNESLFIEMLPYVDAAKLPNGSVLVAKTLKGKNRIFDKDSWRLLTDSMKIRLLIYYSNFEDSVNEFEVFKGIYMYEKDRNNLVILAALTLYANLYLKDNPLKQQRNFLKAHEYVLQYILQCFNQEKDSITSELKVLLEKCRESYDPFHSVIWFCDAKNCKNANESTYCPKGEGRVSFGNMKCPANVIWKKETTSFERQSIKDFMLNIGYVPDCSELKTTFEEYPYKLSALVNRYIAMKKRLVCSKCGKQHVSNFEYSKKMDAKISATRFSCSECKDESGMHDENIYLNYCLCCGEVIDSRVCKHTDAYGYYICMHCGSSKQYRSGTICPKCGSRNVHKFANKAVCGNDRCDYRFVIITPRQESNK